MAFDPTGTIPCEVRLQQISVSITDSGTLQSRQDFGSLSVNKVIYFKWSATIVKIPEWKSDSNVGEPSLSLVLSLSLSLSLLLAFCVCMRVLS